MSAAWTLIVHGARSGFRVTRDAALRAVPDAAIVEIERCQTFAACLAQAIATIASDFVVLVEAGYEPLPEGLSELARVLGSGTSLATGPIRVESRDGVYGVRWRPGGSVPLEVLRDPRTVAPVWAATRAALSTVSFDSALSDLEIVDAWVQLIEKREHGAVVLTVPVARIDAGRQSRWHLLAKSPAYRDAFRCFLQKHQVHVERGMTRLLVDAEVGFGLLRRRHRELLQRRDDALRTLDALRAEVAHHRAFLAHHGLDRIDWGSFDRVDPIARDWGYARGGPVDRRYIRAFIARHSSDVKGCVLEVQENDLTQTYGAGRVSRADVLDIDPANPRATVIDDLRDARQLPDAGFDCVILTQTAHVIDDPAAVLRECHRVLKPGGVMLATFPSVSRVCLEYGPSGDFWRVTPAGARSLAAKAFGAEVQVEAFGNVQTTIAFLHGLGEAELPGDRYAETDPYNPMLVGVRARRPVPGSRRSEGVRGAVLLYHRVGSVGDDPFDLTISTDRFHDHLKVLQAGATIVDLDRLLTDAPEDLPDRAVAITFDDGYLEHLTEVAPILHAQRIPATFFVTSAGLEEDVEYWWDVLERAAVADEARRALHDRLVAATLDERRALIDTLRRQKTLAGPSGRRPLRAEELRSLASHPGVTIGAHGVHHLLLPRQTIEVRMREMRDCRRALEAALDRRVRLFAYPYGGVDDATADAARAEFAFSVDCTPATVPASFDAARVPRLDVKGWTPATCAERLEALFSGVDAPRSVSFLP